MTLQHPANKVWKDIPEPAPLTRCLADSPDGFAPGSFKVVQGSARPILMVWTGTFWQNVPGAVLTGMSWTESPDGKTHVERTMEISLTQYLPDCPADEEVIKE